jgi:16S rRNA (adenine1518-N6/adenine1519-N6)-dimethyltransferase
LSWVRSELKNLGIPPLKRFGQHFLVDKRIRDVMVNAAELRPTDEVLEVGAGLGFLTAALCAQPCHVTVVEKDRTLSKHLRSKFSNKENLTVIEGNALTLSLQKGVKVVSSPPYNISSQLIRLILASHFKLAVLLLQKEFVERMAASAGSRDYGRLTVMVQTSARAEKLAEVPRYAFYPAPRVDSAVVRIEPKNPEVTVSDPLLFSELVRFLFTQRRRKLSGVLNRYLKKRYPRVIDQIPNIAPSEQRIFEVSPAELINLSNLLSEAGVRAEHGIEDKNSSRRTREDR